MLTPDYQCRLHKEEIVAININSDQTIRIDEHNDWPLVCLKEIVFMIEHSRKLHELSWEDQTFSCPCVMLGSIPSSLERVLYTSPASKTKRV